MVLLPCHFLLFKVFRSNSRGHHNNLGNLFLACATSPATAVARNLEDLFIEEVLLGWRGCQLLWIHGSWDQEISWSSSHGQFHGHLSPLKVTCVFLTVAALRIKWAGVICARVVRSRFLDAASTSAKRNFLSNRTPISALFGHAICGLVGSLFTWCIR